MPATLCDDPVGVIAGLDPAIHSVGFAVRRSADGMDARVKHGHDGGVGETCRGRWHENAGNRPLMMKGRSPEMMKPLSMLSLTLAAGTAVLALAAAPASADGVVNVYNWTDYIGETTLEDFTKATGIEVVYDTYDAAETEEAKVLAGNSGYDVVLHSGSQMPRFIEAGAFQKTDKSKLPNWKHLDETILKALDNWDPGVQYSVPYMWGTTGITYNLDMVKERLGDSAPLDSMAMILDPQYASKLADCGISVLESPRDVIPMALAYLGLDPNSEDAADYDKVVELFKPVREYIKTFDSANYLNALPNNELCVVNNWSGDYATATSRAAEAGVKINLAYYVPKTGSPLWFDAWAIPADAPNADNAHAFLDYLMDPEVIAKCTNFTYYANANKDANQFVEKSILDDPAVYTPAEVVARLWTSKSLSDSSQQALIRAWTKIKTGS
jgi:putrescine transport system substrate-binding protein